MSEPEKCYLAIAYRYGWTNNGHYFVAGGADPDVVTEAAEEEHAGRGGKYGVLVCEVHTDEVYAYFPSAWGEKEATFNQRIGLAERLGLDVISAVEDGQTLQPAPEDREERGLLTYQAAPIPDWLRQRHDHEKQIYEILYGPQNETE